jgi:hypothetical protein
MSATVDFPTSAHGLHTHTEHNANVQTATRTHGVETPQHANTTTGTIQQVKSHVSSMREKTPCSVRMHLIMQSTLLRVYMCASIRVQAYAGVVI